MIRTQVYFPEELYMQVKLLAQHQNQPAAVMIRRFVASGIKKTKRNAREALLDLASIATNKGPKDLSTRHDDYLYGDE